MAATTYFDDTWYLAQYPDVAEAVTAGWFDAWTHFQRYGAQEDRAPNAWFDTAFYLRQNPDIAAAVSTGSLTAMQHFLWYGVNEARPVNAAVNLQAYLQANPDVTDAVAQGKLTALAHLLHYGQQEGRNLGNGVSLTDFHHDSIFNGLLDAGDVNAALARVEAVVPFMPAFQRPADWKPAPDTPIPIDFQPAPGKKLKVPDDIRIPDGMVLPDTFEHPQPDDGQTTFAVSVAGGVLHVAGTASGPITIESDDNGVTLQFTRAGFSATVQPAAADLTDGVGLPAAPGFTVDAALFAHIAAKFATGAARIGDAAVTDQADLQAIAQYAGKLAPGGFASSISVDYVTGTWQPTDLASLLSAYAGTQAEIDADTLTDASAISAILTAAQAGKVVDGKLMNLSITSTAFDAISDSAKVEAAIPDGGAQALTITVDDAGCGCNEIDAASYGKGLILIGGTNDSVLVGGSGNDVFIGRADNDAMMLEMGGSDIVQFGGSASANGLNFIQDFQAGALATGGDMLNFSAFVTLAGVMTGDNLFIPKSISMAVGLFTGFEANLNLNLESKALIVADIDTVRSNLADQTGQNKAYLEAGAKAVVLARQDPHSDIAYDIYYVTGGSTPLIEPVGTLLTNRDDGQNVLIIANLM